MGKLVKEKKKVSCSFKHSYMYLWDTFLKKRQKVLNLIESNVYITFAKQSKALKYLFESVRHKK